MEINKNAAMTYIRKTQDSKVLGVFCSKDATSDERERTIKDIMKSLNVIPKNSSDFVVVITRV